MVLTATSVEVAVRRHVTVLLNNDLVFTLEVVVVRTTRRRIAAAVPSAVARIRAPYAENISSLAY